MLVTTYESFPTPKLFINHFGGNGVLEAIWHGVPMVGMLCGSGGDNAEISELAVWHRIAIRVDTYPTVNEVWTALNTVLTNDR